MKQFFTAIAANFVTIAIVVVLFFMLMIGIAASIGSGGATGVQDGAVLVIDMDDPLVDAPAELQRRSALDGALSGNDGGVPMRAALLAVREAASDNRISGILIRGNAASDFAEIRELRNAILDFRKKTSKPVHAYLVTPQTRDYYLASAATTVTMDPFGSLLMPGIAAEAVFLSGALEKYGIGVQVTRVGRFKAAVEPLTRTSMSPENREQTSRYVGALWTEVKQAISESRKIDTTALQQLVDSKGVLLADEARAAGLVDRVAYWDVVLGDVRHMVAAARGDRSPSRGSDSSRSTDSAVSRDSSASHAEFRRIPQISLRDYAIVATAKNIVIGAQQKVAVVYANGSIVDGEGGPGMIGGEALARDLRRVRLDDDVKAVVLRVNSPGGSAIASETMQRELALIADSKPVVVSMGSVAASGGYWISTASNRIFVQPNTITGSIGVFGLLPNVKTIANRHGITFDTVKTGRYADIYSISRPRTPAELEIIQRSVDAIYDAFIARVAASRKLSPDSVRVIAEGRVWAGDDAIRIGLADSIGGLETAIASARGLAKITGDFRIEEYPRRKRAAELFSEMFERKSPPIADALARGGAAGKLLGDIARELSLMIEFGDPRGVYARLPFVLNVR